MDVLSASDGTENHQLRSVLAVCVWHKRFFSFFVMKFGRSSEMPEWNIQTKLYKESIVKRRMPYNRISYIIAIILKKVNENIIIFIINKKMYK